MSLETRLHSVDRGHTILYFTVDGASYRFYFYIMDKDIIRIE